MHLMLLRSILIFCVPVRSLPTCPLDLAALNEDLLLLLALLLVLGICGMIVPVAILVRVVVKGGPRVSLKHIAH